MVSTEIKAIRFYIELNIFLYFQMASNKVLYFQVASNKVSTKVKAISFAENGSYFVTAGNR